MTAKFLLCQNHLSTAKIFWYEPYVSTFSLYLIWPSFVEKIDDLDNKVNVILHLRVYKGKAQVFYIQLYISRRRFDESHIK